MENIKSQMIAEKTPEVLAVEINLIKERTARQVITASIEIGERLIAAKELVGHGEWENWLQDNVNYSASTAQNLMRISREYGNTQAMLCSSGQSPQEIFGNLTYSQAVALFALPLEERIEFTETHDVENTSTRELKEEIERYKAEKAESERRIEELTDEVKAERIERSNAQTAAAAAENEVETQRSAVVQADERYNRLLEQKSKIEKEFEILKQQFMEVSSTPAEITDEQRAEIESKIEQKFSDRINQLTLDADTANSKLSEMQAERDGLIRKLQQESDVELQKFQTLFERLQQDVTALNELTYTIGGERGEKLRRILRSVINNLTEESNSNES